MNPQTVIELAESENRRRLSNGVVAASSPAMRNGTGAVRATVGAAMVRWGRRFAAGRPADASAPRRLAVNTAQY